MGWSLVTKVACGRLSDPAGRNVKPEQASKVTMRMPTLLPFGEGGMSGEASTRAPARSAGVVGTECRKGGSGNRGRPVLGEGSGLNVAACDGQGGSRTRGAAAPPER